MNNNEINDKGDKKNKMKEKIQNRSILNTFEMQIPERQITLL